MKKHYLLRKLFNYLTIFSMLTVINVNGQENPRTENLQFYDKLKERFNIFLVFQKEKNYEKLYDMFAQEQRKSINKKFFIEIYKNSEKEGDKRLSNFVIKNVGLLEFSNIGIVEGCGEYTELNEKEYYESQVEA